MTYYNRIVELKKEIQESLLNLVVLTGKTNTVPDYSAFVGLCVEDQKLITHSNQDVKYIMQFHNSLILVDLGGNHYYLEALTDEDQAGLLDNLKKNLK